MLRNVIRLPPRIFCNAPSAICFAQSSADIIKSPAAHSCAAMLPGAISRPPDVDQDSLRRVVSPLPIAAESAERAQPRKNSSSTPVWKQAAPAQQVASRRPPSRQHHSRARQAFPATASAMLVAKEMRSFKDQSHVRSSLDRARR